MCGSIRCSGRLVLVAALAATSMAMLLPRPALSSSAPPAAAAASTNIIHHGGNGNPANALVAAVNANRTAARLPPLRNSKGLGCMALQYLAHCLATATQDISCRDDTQLASSCHPPERDVTEVYAANCGVELPTVDLLSARLLGCSVTHDGGSALLVTGGANASAMVRGKEHTQVGAGVLRGFWCLLFSAGKPGTTFRLEAAGRGIAQPHGCFSDPDDDTLTCSSGSSGERRLLASSVPLLLLLAPLWLAL